MPEKITQSLVNNLEATGKEYDIRDLELKGFLVRVQKSGNASYVIAYRNKLNKSKRYTIANVKDITATQARKRASDLKLVIANGKDPFEEEKSEQRRAERLKTNTLNAFFNDRFINYSKIHHKDSDGAIKRLSKFVDRWGDIPLDEIDIKLLNSYRDERILAGIANSTINRDLNCLRKLFSLAVEEDVIGSNPFNKLKPLKVDKNPKTRCLSADEEAHLISALQARQKITVIKRTTANKWREEREYNTKQDLSDYEYSNYLMPLVLLALKTGCRRNELLSLTWENVTFEENNNSIYIQGSNTKNAQSRTIPLNNEGVSILKEWKRFCDASSTSNLVFPSPKTDKQMTEVGSAWNRVLLKAKIENFCFHDLRHTFASRLAIKGVDLNTIRELMGHADISMTLRYAHLSPDHLKNAVEGI